MLLFFASTVSAQIDSLSPKNEFLMFFQNSSFTDPSRTHHITLTAQYYYSPSRRFRIFGDFSSYRKFDQDDRSAGLGMYLLADRKNSFYGFLALGFSPKIIPKVDLTAEYTRLLADRLAGIIEYRTMAFTSESVQMLVPGLTVYEIPRWTFTPKVFLAKLSSASDIRSTFFLHVAHDLSERVSPELYYAVGSESYRAGSLDYLASQHSWGITIGSKITCTESLRLRLHYQHIVRAGYFEENGVDAALSYLW
jgi:YaiO family outer membrane protein